jgi:hypothetical protein
LRKYSIAIHSGRLSGAQPLSDEPKIDTQLNARPHLLQRQILSPLLPKHGTLIKLIRHRKRFRQIL